MSRPDGTATIAVLVAGVRSPCIGCIAFALAILLAFLGLAPRAAAHPANLTAAVAQVSREGEVRVMLTFDVLALAVNDTPERVPDRAMLALLNGPRAELERRMKLARTHFERHFAVLADDAPVAFSLVQFPTSDAVARAARDGAPAPLPLLLSCEVRARLPESVRHVSFVFPEVIGPVVLTVERHGEEPTTEALAGGATSSNLAFAVVRPAGPAVSAPRGATAAGIHQRLAQLLGFVRLGFLHILPRGLDHVLFVLGLFLLGGRLSSLLWQVSAFTLAHTVTLGLSLYGVLHAPAAVIEPLIALSIALVAVDNLRGAGLQPWRIAVVFGFGLVHGLGFAGALRELGLPRSEFLRALVGFNVGVELGQLAVIALAFATVGWLRSGQRYRQWVVIPASVAIALVALVWTYQRIAA